MKYTLKSVQSLAATLITLGSITGGANAAISVTRLGGGDRYLADIGTITFNITSSGSVEIVTVEDFYIGPNTDTSSTPVVSNVSYSINGGPSILLSLGINSGSYGADYGFWDNNDFVFCLTSVLAVTNGNTLSFSGSFQFDASGLTTPASNGAGDVPQIVKIGGDWLG